MTIEELQAENAELKRQIAEDREKGQDLTVKTIFKLSDEIKALKAQLEEYEQKVKDGRLVELPCKVGDKVYIPYPSVNEIEEWQVASFHIYENIVLRLRNLKNEYIALDIKDLGKEWFFTYFEAKKRLAEVKGEEQGQERLHNDNSAER